MISGTHEGGLMGISAEPAFGVSIIALHEIPISLFLV